MVRVHGGLNDRNVPGHRADRRDQRAQFHHASTPPVRSRAGISVQAGVPGNGVACRWLRPAGVTPPGGGSGWTWLQSYNYWSGTEYAPSPGNAWNFNTNDGNQNNNDKNNGLYAVAVRPGG